MKTAENFIQQSSVIWFRNSFCLKQHSPRCIIYSVPNESEDAYETQKKINTGLMKGAADLIILLPNGKCLLPETKTPTGCQSSAQKAFQEQAEALGHIYFLYRSLEEFQTKVTPYLREAGINV